VPVVREHLQLRQNLIIWLYVLIGLSIWLADGAVFVARALVKREWESDLPQFRFELIYILLLGSTYIGAAIALARDRISGKLKRSWKSRYPIVLVCQTAGGEAALLGVFAAWIRKQRPVKPDVYTILHLSFLAFRVLTLLILLFSFSRYMKRKRFISAKSSGYGTFESDQKTAQTKPDAQQQGISLSVLASRIRILFPYLYPKNSKALQLIAVICLLLLALGRVVNLLVPIFLGRIVTSLGSGNSNMWRDLAIYIALKFCQGSGGILQVIQSNLWIAISQYSDREMSLMAFNHLLNLSMAYHTRRKTGEVLRVLDRGSALNSFFQMVLFQIMPIFADIGVAVVYLALRFGLLLSAVVAGVMLLYVWISVALTQQRTQYRRAMNEADKHCRAIHTDALISVESVKYFTAEAFESNRYRDAMKAYQKEELKVLMSLSFLNLVQNVTLSIGLLLGSLVIAFQVVSGQRDVSDFITFVTYMQQLAGPLNILGTLYRAITQNVTDSESLFKLLQEPREIEDAPDAQTLQVRGGEIEFKDVSFSYDGRVKALDNISLKIPAGKSAAFVGPSGRCAV
jgi:hypothetical protein